GAGDLVERRGGAGDGQLAVADLFVVAAPAQLGAGTIGIAREAELRVPIVRPQHRELGHAAKIVEHVVDLPHVLADYQRPLHVTVARHDHTRHHADQGDDDQGNKKFKDTHHSKGLRTSLRSTRMAVPGWSPQPRDAVPPMSCCRDAKGGSAIAEATDVTCSRAGTLLPRISVWMAT